MTQQQPPVAPVFGPLPARPPDLGATAIPLGPSPEERVAALILSTTRDAQDAILATTERAVRDIVRTASEAMTAVPTAMATPPPQFDIDALARAMVNGEQSGDGYLPESPFIGGINPNDPNYDPTIDIVIDEHGTRWMPDYQHEPQIPSMHREMSGIVAPGTELVPGIPRLDLGPYSNG